jgi:hypothetical protein
MANYVLLQFDNEDEASAFMEAAREDNVFVSNKPGSLARLPIDLRGLFKKPTKFCDCANTGGNLKKRGFTRGKKFGWWVCDRCHKPTKSWGRGDHWFLALGRNLLPIDAWAPEYRGDGVFARSVKTCPECSSALVVEVGHAACITYCPTCKKDV